MTDIRSDLLTPPKRSESLNCLNGLESVRSHPRVLSVTPVSESTRRLQEPFVPLVRTRATFVRKSALEARPVRRSRLPAPVFEPPSRSVKPESCSPTGPVGWALYVSPRTRSGSELESPGETSRNESW